MSRIIRGMKMERIVMFHSLKYDVDNVSDCVQQCLQQDIPVYMQAWTHSQGSWVINYDYMHINIPILMVILQYSN